MPEEWQDQHSPTMHWLAGSRQQHPHKRIATSNKAVRPRSLLLRIAAQNAMTNAAGSSPPGPKVASEAATNAMT